MHKTENTTSKHPYQVTSTWLRRLQAHIIKYIKQRALLAKLTVTPLLMKFEVFSGTRGLITLFRRARQFALTSTRLFQCASSFMDVLFARANLAEETIPTARRADPYCFSFRGWVVQKALRYFLVLKASTPALKSTQPPIKWVTGVLRLRVTRRGRKGEHSLPPGTEVKN